MRTDQQLLDFLDAAIGDLTVTDFPGIMSHVLDAANEDGTIRSAIDRIADVEGYTAEQAAEAEAGRQETGRSSASELAFLAEDHGRLQWAFLLIDSGKAPDLAGAVAIMREKA